MDGNQETKTDRLRLTGKVLGGGYPVFALIISWRGVQDLVAIWTPADAAADHAQPTFALC
jgi:hypothetical protein